MMKLNVLYPHSDGMRFDHDYYRDKHMPMVAQRLGDACLSYTVDRGVAGGAPDAPLPFAAACSFFCESAEMLQAAFAPHAAEIMGDIANYTNAQPVIWFSDAVVDRR